MPLPHEHPQSEALVPLAAPPKEPFPETIPAETFRGLPKEECVFIVRYLEHGNAARAFREAGMEEGRSTDTWQHFNNASQSVMRRPRVKAALARAQAFFAYHTGLHAWQILGALHTHAFIDPVDMYERDGENWNMRPMGEWPLALRQSVQRITIKEWESDGGVKRQIDVELANRQNALFLLGKHLKLYEKKDHQVAPFTLVLNTNAPEGAETMKKVGEVIEGIGLKINLPNDS